MPDENEKKNGAPKRANAFLLGADPEFVFLDDKGLAITEPRDFYGTSERQIGQDCGVLVELRPKPAETAYELVARIKSLLEHPIMEKCQQFRWRSGGVAQYQSSSGQMATITMGGHIHFDARFFLRVSKRKNPICSFCRRGDCQHETTFEYPAELPLNRLTALLEHLDILPQAESNKRATCGQGYGSANDAVRASNLSYEYRRMCSWLFHPRAAFIVLTLAKLCLVDPDYMKSALYQKTSFDDLKKIAETFAEKDDDAARLKEKIFAVGLTNCQIDPTENLRPRWNRWKPEGVVLT